jgi:hypothetical protein
MKFKSVDVKQFLWGNLKGSDNLEDPGINGRMILRWMFKKWDVAGTCDCGNESSGSIKCGESLD